MKKKVYLTLQNGTVFQGYRFGKEENVTGELVFSTGMVGYMETLTDPSCYGQIVVNTFPMIGNYGVMHADMESSKAWAFAFIVREFCDKPSNFRSEGTLDEFLKEQGVVGVYGVDTRQLTKILREEGAMIARISDKPLTGSEVQSLAIFEFENTVSAVSDDKKGYFAAENAKYTVVLWDLGVKNSTISQLTEKGCNVIKMPASSTANEILALEADGIVIAGGPGEPSGNVSIIREVKKVLGKKPVWGMGLGHQIVALALGASTQKHKYGHRGSNQPVKCTKTDKVYISSQNHGYEVVAETIRNGEILFVNVNDGSCEGIDYPAHKAFTTQFSPEACSIGEPENPLYQKFFTLMNKENENA